MNEVPSFERFDYLLRANKQIERKLVFDLLSRAKTLIGFKQHRYLGFGSMWFGDFRMAHRLLEIDNLISIERTKYAPRADFNRPYDSIRVMPGDCSDILEGFTDQDWLEPYISWLDYDGRLDERMAADLGVFLEKCAPDSISIITVNASRGSYRAKDADPKNRNHTAVGAVEHFLGSETISAKYQLSPNELGVYSDVSVGEFPIFLAESIITFMAHRVASLGRANALGPIRFVPIFSFSHKDSADMVTVGGAISSAEKYDRWSELLGESRELKHRRIDLVPITVKEKMVLDACLPCAADNEFMARVQEAGVKIDESQLVLYRQIYRHFPVFVESMF